jgi:CRISPR-associated protein Csb1
MKSNIQQFDKWLDDNSDVAALVMRQWLVPVEGKDAVVFPPTYTLNETEAGARFQKGEDVPGVYKGAKGSYGYNIDQFENGLSVCQIDSVGSQANRMEPIFLRNQYRSLVPMVTVRATVDGQESRVNLLEAGHRAADAIVRFSSLWQELEAAFRSLRNDGNAEPLAKLAPTSLVFGAWDSRLTQVKLPRIVRSVIRAYSVRPLHRSAQYIPPVDYVGEGLLEAPEGKQQKDAMSELGLSHAPAPWSHGGVLVQKEIRREAALNFAALRSLGVGKDKDGKDRDPLPLRRYILGLSLVAFTAPQETFLREGCQLVPDPERATEWSVVRHDGTRESRRVTDDEAANYAAKAASEFGVGSAKEAQFNAQTAREALGQTKEERKKARRSKTKSGEEESKT